MPGSRALIVITTGKSLIENGTLEKLVKQLDLANIKYGIYDKITPNPLKSQIMNGAQFAKKSGCDFVIGLGGGSSIDAAKAISIMSTNAGDYWDYVRGGSGKGREIINQPLPVVAITTTSGTGTEADPWIVITEDESNEKIGFGTDKTFPVLSIVDPELMTSVPPLLTAYQGFDALFHSIEGYLSSLSNEISNIFALKAIRSISENLESAVKNGIDTEARSHVALGSTMSGFVQYLSSTISAHSLEHALSAYHHNLAHGAGLIMISEAYYTLITQSGSCDEKLINIAIAMGMKNASKPTDFIDQLIKLQKATGVFNLRMSDYQIDYEDMEKYVLRARETMGWLFKFDPIPLSDEDCITILKKSYK